MPPCDFQGGRPTCTAFAVTAGHEFLRQGVTRYSQEDLFFSVKQGTNDGAHDRGIFVSDALEFVCNSGQVHYELWPYSVVQPVPYEPPEAVVGAQRHRVKKWEPLYGMDEAQTACADGLPVVFVVQLSKSLRETPPAGVIPKLAGPVYGLHAMLLAGYEGALEDANGFWILRNSWGSRWGRDGYGFLNYADHEQVTEMWVLYD